jgi:AraC family transcriptional regulator of arabinose operon
MDRRIAKALAIMRREFHRDLRVEELARAVNLSPSRFAHLFRAETGLAPKQCLARLRLERAKALLEGSFLSVKEVMAAVGFSDPSHFSRDFKRLHGLVPTALRRAEGAGTANE